MPAIRRSRCTGAKLASVASPGAFVASSSPRSFGFALVLVGGVLAAIGFWIRGSSPEPRARTVQSPTDRGAVAYRLRWPALAALLLGIVLAIVN